jgi:membrane protein implicated in regulation of membrane protease activity
MMIEPYMVFVWIGIALLFAVIEGATMGLVTIWFTIGAGLAAIAAALDASMLVQVIIFIVISFVLLLFTRPLLKHKLKVGQEKNSVDQYIGAIGIVIEAIKPFSQGRIKLKSLEWAAVCYDQEMGIEAGKEVEVIRIEGVKAIVKSRG